MDFKNVAFHCSYGISSQLPESSRAEVAFAGRSNVGKSSLINKVLNRKSLARARPRPSTSTPRMIFT